jgi:UDP-N-acetylglucosamine acyltransferase
MTEIHPTAVVDRQAELAQDARIGPYSVIGPEVSIGPGCQVMSHVVITGRTTLGQNNRVWHHTVLGAEPQDLKYRGEPAYLEIGDRNDIREFVTMHIGTANGGGATTVGDDNLFMVGAHVAHDSHVASHCILANNALLAGHITIEDYAVISGGAAIHHYVTIGRYAFIGGNSGVVHDCPPYMNTDGHPARVRSVNTIGLHRHQFDEATIENLKGVCRLIYRRDNGQNQEAGIAHAEAEFGSDPACHEVCRFARRAAQGINGRQREALRPDNKRVTPPR